MQQDPDQAEKEDGKLQQSGFSAWTSTSLATLIMAQTRYKERLSQQRRELLSWNFR